MSIKSILQSIRNKVTNKSRQAIGDVHQSNVTQVVGNVTYVTNGVDRHEVEVICNDVIKTRMDVYTQTASTIAETRLQAFTDKFTNKLENVTDEVIVRLQQPAIQFALRQSIKGSIETDDEELTEELIDMMIERMESGDKETKSFVIDSARQLLPHLSWPHLYFLAILAFLSLQLASRQRFHEYIKYKLDKALKAFPSITELDLRYLEQVGCLGNPDMYIRRKVVEENLISGHKLFFVHPTDLDTLNNIMRENGVTKQIENDILGFVDFTHHPDIYLLINDICFIQNTDINISPTVVKVISQLAKKCAPMSKDEVKAYLIGENSSWKDAIAILNDPLVCKFHLTPVGTYLGLRVLSRISGEPLPMSLFYNRQLGT